MTTPLADVLIAADYTAIENVRVTMSGGAYTVTKPATVVDPIEGTTRPPLNGAVIEIADDTDPQRWIYVSELAGWQKMHDLGLTDVQPFGPTHEQGIAAMLAARMCEPVFQRQPSQTLVTLAQDGRRNLRQRFQQTVFVQTDPLLLNRFQRMGTNI